MFLWRFVFIAILLFAGSAQAVPSFPGCEGYYCEDRNALSCGFVYATPSTWPTICKVNSLECSTSGSCLTTNNVEVCSGSLLYCLNTLNRPEGKYVVFETSGTIRDCGYLKVTNQCTRIVGQSAPAPGIFVRGAEIRLETGGSIADHFLMEHIVVAAGDENVFGPNIGDTRRKPFRPGGGKFVIDNATLLWGTDSAMDMEETSSRGTISNSILAETLNDSIHIDEGQITPAPHSTCFLITDGGYATLRRSLLAHCDFRNPKFGGDKLELVNNVIYNWDSTGTARNAFLIDDDNGPIDVDARYNYFLCGPNSRGKCSTQKVIQIENNGPLDAGSDFCIQGNVYETLDETAGLCRDVNDDGVPDCASQDDISEYAANASCPGPAASTSVPVTTITTNIQTLFSDLILSKNVGSRPADAVKPQWAAAFAPQLRILSEVADDCSGCTNGGSKDCVGGVVTCDHDAGGWPTVAVNTATFNIPTDPFGDSDADGWLNIEECIYDGTGCNNASYTTLVEPETSAGGGVVNPPGPVDPGALAFDHCEEVSCSIGDTDSCSATIASVNPAKSILTFGWNRVGGTVNEPRREFVRGLLENSTTVRFYVGNTDVGRSLDVFGHVCEFSSGVNVVRGELYNLTTTEESEVLDLIENLGESFVLQSYSTAGSTYGDDDGIVCRLFDDSGTYKIGCSSGATSASNTLNYQVVQIAGIACEMVQDTGMGSGDLTETEALDSAVTVADSFVVGYAKHGNLSASGMSQAQLKLDFADANTLRAVRSSSGIAISEILAYVCDTQGTIDVTSWAESFPSSNGSQTESVTLTADNTYFALSSFWGMRGSQSYNADDILESAYKISSTTTTATTTRGTKSATSDVQNFMLDLASIATTTTTTTSTTTTSTTTTSTSTTTTSTSTSTSTTTSTSSTTTTTLPSSNADFNFQHGVTTFGASEDSEAASFTAVAALGSSFEMLTNTQLGCAVAAGTSTDRNNDDQGATILMSAVDTMTLTRETGGDNEDMACPWTLGEYIGDPGGANEIITRLREVHTLANADASDDITISSVADINDLVCLAAGLRNPDVGENLDRAKVRCVSVFEDPNNVCRCSRQDTTGETNFTLLAIEFTGTNWSVQQVTHAFLTPGTNEIENISAVTLANSFILSNFEHQDVANDELGAIVWFKDTDEVYFRRTGTSSNNGSPTVTAYVISNAGLSVQHFDSVTGAGTDITGTTMAASDLGITITGAGTLLMNQVMMIMTADASSVGGVYPRAFMNYRLVDTGSDGDMDDVEVFRARSGDTAEWALQIVDFSGLEGANPTWGDYLQQLWQQTIGRVVR